MDFTQLYMQGGMSLVIAYIAYKAIGKLYADMRDDSKAREDRLMNYLDKKNETDAKVAQTLEDITEELKSTNHRIDKLEGCKLEQNTGGEA